MKRLVRVTVWRNAGKEDATPITSWVAAPLEGVVVSDMDEISVKLDWVDAETQEPAEERRAG